MNRPLTLLSLLAALSTTAEPKPSTSVTPGLVGANTVLTSAFPGEEVFVICHRPAKSQSTPPTATLFLMGSSTASPMTHGIVWTKVSNGPDEALYQSFTASFAAPETDKPLNLLLRVSPYGDSGPTGIVRIDVRPPRLPKIFRSLTQNRTLWVEEDWTPLQIWLDQEDIPYEILPASSIAFREGDLLLARLPSDEKERIRETESLATCPEQLWVNENSGAASFLRITEGPSGIKVTATAQAASFPPQNPTEESFFVEALAPFLQDQS